MHQVIQFVVGSIFGISAFLAVFYFVSRFAHQSSGSRLDLASFIGFPLGAFMAWVVISFIGLFFLYTRSSEEDRRTVIMFSAFVPIVGVLIYSFFLLVGSLFFAHSYSFWTRFAISSTIIAVPLLVAMLGFFSYKQIKFI